MKKYLSMAAKEKESINADPDAGPGDDMPESAKQGGANNG